MWGWGRDGRGWGSQALQKKCWGELLKVGQQKREVPEGAGVLVGRFPAFRSAQAKLHLEQRWDRMGSKI